MNQLQKKLLKAISQGLPGMEAQLKMAPEGRELLSNGTRKSNAAVLILLYKNIEKKWSIVLMKRQPYNGHHSAQISFPGGKEEEEDLDLSFTALRECEEEIGIHKENIELISKLTELFIPVSNFLVHPYIGIYTGTPSFKIDTSEVEYLIEETVDAIANKPIESTWREYNGNSYQIPYFNIKNEMVWGATAMILSEFMVLYKRAMAINL